MAYVSKLIEDYAVEFLPQSLKRIGKDALLGEKLQAVIAKVY
ncbi:hypothetical protein [Holospora undulata]|uniref:Uncharacterized protein n=1 Tax=Holospora undulata HU1 TaxID=1321371 RepID=A0A061JH45_9PROT|nr:hypothetical protein [Holospora undulata]ETZ05501.1 hypothetical protein K737_300060 [Holospora undulata HU1]